MRHLFRGNSSLWPTGRARYHNNISTYSSYRCSCWFSLYHLFVLLAASELASKKASKQASKHKRFLLRCKGIGRRFRPSEKLVFIRVGSLWREGSSLETQFIIISSSSAVFSPEKKAHYNFKLCLDCLCKQQPQKFSFFLWLIHFIFSRSSKPIQFFYYYYSLHFITTKLLCFSILFLSVSGT